MGLALWLCFDWLCILRHRSSHHCSDRGRKALIHSFRAIAHRAMVDSITFQPNNQ